ncbi:MAG: hypothetical protein ACOVLE_13460 [Pirellula staleyi]
MDDRTGASQENSGGDYSEGRAIDSKPCDATIQNPNGTSTVSANQWNFLRRYHGAKSEVN